MQAPAMFFESSVPKELGSRIVGVDWKAVTLPAPHIIIPNLPCGIFFSQKARDVPDQLFKHEFTHYRQSQALGAVLFYLCVIIGYSIKGYDAALLEKQARDAERLPFTPQEKLWVEMARKMHK